MAGAGSITNFMVGWKVEANHFIVAALGNHTSSHNYSKMAHWKARAGIKECKRMADAGSITNFMVGWKVEASHFIVVALGNHTSSHTLFQNGPLQGEGWHQGMQKDGMLQSPNSGFRVEASLLCGGSWAALETKWRNAKKWFAHLPWACLHMAQGWAPFRRLCPHPRHLWSNDQWLWIRTTWIMAALQKPEQISTDFSYNLKITIKWGVSDPLKGCSWRYIKRNMACLDPSHFIEDMFMGIIYIYMCVCYMLYYIIPYYIVLYYIRYIYIYYAYACDLDSYTFECTIFGTTPSTHSRDAKITGDKSTARSVTRPGPRAMTHMGLEKSFRFGSMALDYVGNVEMETLSCASGTTYHSLFSCRFDPLTRWNSMTL